VRAATDHHQLVDDDGNLVVLRDVRTRWGRWWSSHERLLHLLAVLALGWGAVYLTWRVGWSWDGANPVLWALLLLCEIGGWISLLGLTWFSWSHPPVRRPRRTPAPPDVDVYVCTYDEPVDVVLPTLVGCASLTVPHTTYLLDDGRRPAMAELAKQHAQDVGLKCTVQTKAGIARQKMNLFLAVNQGSENEPRLIHMVHKPARPKAKVVFVGKGLTFDAGGLCLKPPKAMADMKCDMAGGAVTIGTLLAVAKLKLPIEVHGLVGATDNMTGGGAYRPGDVFTARSGKTVEIINTDAEGRLVLADVLSYATEIGADYLIDHATLTGACMVALGPWRAALYANDDEMGRAYEDAAEAAGETFWRMPLDAELKEMLKSDVADIKHVGDAFGGSITAALFLQEFVGESRWVHLDIAGPAFQQSPHGVHPKGGTGFGVATAVRFLEGLVG